MSAGIFALIGVVTGGLLNAGVTYLFDRRGSQRAAKTASRLVYQELMVNGAAIEVAASHREWEPLIEHLDLGDWEANRQVLAASLTDEEWTHLVRAYYFIGSLAGESKDRMSSDRIDPDNSTFATARLNMHIAGRLMGRRCGVTDSFHPWDNHMPEERRSDPPHELRKFMRESGLD